MHYLIRTIEHNGHTFTDVTKIRENETYQVVEAASKEETKRLYRAAQLKNTLSSLSKGASNLRKAMQRKDSE
ncbi:DUF1381 domain-containing protein [Staphylococcus xylosus]|uniref:DUF1381 domain-containing protein n=1 Tax=Staphylococcus xylosus TaxID=1288 RepID=UPI000E6A7ED6|nr:DUF1381 domain-containing protein [Staphylococcus xylosus]RIM94768.1 DUF1381 domain-containing protein [Staphylococcus xylosus]